MALWYKFALVCRDYNPTATSASITKFWYFLAVVRPNWLSSSSVNCKCYNSWNCNLWTLMRWQSCFSAFSLEDYKRRLSIWESSRKLCGSKGPLKKERVTNQIGRIFWRSPSYYETHKVQSVEVRRGTLRRLSTDWVSRRAAWFNGIFPPELSGFLIDLSWHNFESNFGGIV